MKRTQIFAVVFVWGWDLVSANISEDPIFPNLKLVASVDGKTYFAERILRTWRSANGYCTHEGMKMGEITTENQWNALVAAYDEEFLGPYWIGASDPWIKSIRGLNHFAWDSTDTTVNGASYGDELTHSDPAMCTGFYYRGAESSYLERYLCATQFYTLCEASAGPLRTKFANF